MCHKLTLLLSNCACLYHFYCSLMSKSWCFLLSNPLILVSNAFFLFCFLLGKPPLRLISVSQEFPGKDKEGKTVFISGSCPNTWATTSNIQRIYKKYMSKNREEGCGNKTRKRNKLVAKIKISVSGFWMWGLKRRDTSATTLDNNTSYTQIYCSGKMILPPKEKM